MKPITTAEEIHEILLGIGKEFHRVCQKHNIPYYMLGGTMLGAVRHGGFIPWDDDMDFGVPREHFEKLKEILRNELPGPYKIVTIDDSDVMVTDIIKIENSLTEMDELYKENFSHHIGLNIDIFPLDSVNLEDTRKVKRAITLSKIHCYRFLSLKQRSGAKKIAAMLSKIVLAGIKRTTLPRKITRMINSDVNATHYANIYGAWGLKEIVDKKIFLPSKLYQFEDVELWGVHDADSYLRQLYGDYMKLPPEEKRHLHVIGCRWK